MTRSLEITCGDPAATQAVAAAIAKTLLPGDMLLLDGDLGAGKTTFTQGLARAMGVDEVVTSPTFALVRSYPTSFGVELIHADVYRLDELSEIVALGLPEMLEDGAVAAIEWGERAGPAGRTRALRPSTSPSPMSTASAASPSRAKAPGGGPAGTTSPPDWPNPMPGSANDGPARHRHRHVAGGGGTRGP